jgi:hypothetical protein
MEEEIRNSECISVEENLQEVRSNNTLVTQQICSLCKGLEADEKYFKSQPCGCSIFCKKCAMKIATGGKCKVCKQMYTSVVGVN